MDRSRLFLLILYLKDQKTFYVENMLLFREVASKFSLPMHRSPINANLPNICRNCGHTTDECIGGALKLVCPTCYDPAQQRSSEEALLGWYYVPPMAEILNCSEQILDSYMSLAMYFIKNPSIASLQYGDLLEN